MKILTMLQLLQHHNTYFSPAGNLEAAALNTRGLLHGGRDNSAIYWKDGGCFLLTMEVYTDGFGSSQLVSKYSALLHCASLGGKKWISRKYSFLGSWKTECRQAEWQS